MQQVLTGSTKFVVADDVSRCQNMQIFDAGHELCLLGAVVGCCGGCNSMHGVGTVKGYKKVARIP